MSTITAVVYFSATGATARLAEAVAAGASQIGKATLHSIESHSIVAGRYRDETLLSCLDAASAIVFGSPTYMGGPASQFKAFADATSERWSEARWADKFAAGFTTGNCANGDQSFTLQYFTILASQHGMLWCNLDIPGGTDRQGRNRLGAQLGVASHTVDRVTNAADVQTALYLGRRVATLASRLPRPSTEKVTPALRAP